MNLLSVAKILSVLCLIHWLLPVTDSENIFVSNKETEKKTAKKKECGSTEDPCRTINAAIQNAKANSDIIVEATKVPYNNCPFYVDKPLNFAGNKGKPVIDCDGRNAFIFNYNPDGPAIQQKINIKLDVSRIKIQNSETGFSFLKKARYGNLRLKDVDFIDNDIDVSWVGASHVCTVAMTNVNAVGHSGNGIEMEGCNKTVLQITQTKFRGKYLKVVSTEKSSELDITMDAVTFDMSERAKEIESKKQPVEHQSPLYIVTALEQSTIIIERSNFSGHFGDRHSMLNITAFKGQPKKKSKQYISRIEIKVNNTKFINNTVQNGVGAAVAFNLSNLLTKNIRNIITFNVSTFIGNTALKGGAVWFSEWKKKTVLFNNSIFIDNKAIGSEDSSGGALFGLGGRVGIKLSKFIGNTATKFGGALYLLAMGPITMKVYDSNFQNKPSWSRAGGDVMYLEGVTTYFYGNVVFNLSSSNSGESIFSYNGIPAVLRMESSTTFICPRGYNYEEAKHSVQLKPKKNQLNGFPTSYHIFAFTCQPCQDLFYTTGRGMLKVNSTEIRGTCHKCPYGASCNGTIRARANFWGKIEGDEIKMIPCPKGYCCNEEPCGSYDSCREHRTGTLCGHCSDGYTESMSSTQCFPNENCNKALWLWPVFNVVVIFVFLSFHQEIIKRLVKWSLWTKGDNDEESVEEYRGNERNHNTSDTEPLVQHSLLSDSDADVINPNNLVLRIENQPDYTTIEESSDYNNSGGYIKVFYYFFQAILLIRLSSYVSNSSFPNWIIDLLTPLLNFQFTSIWTCAGEHWRPVTKVFVKNSVAYWVLGCSFTMYVIYRLLRKYKGISIDDAPAFKSRSFPVRLTGTVVHVILFSYVAQTQFTVQLLNCVEVGDQNVLFIDGSVSCYRPYQVLVWIYFVFSIVAFPFALLAGQILLFSGRISRTEFLVGCFFPLLFLCRCAYRYIRHYKGDRIWHQLRSNVNDPFKDKIKYILRYPYKSSQSRHNPTKIELCRENWEVVLLLRRLILVLVFIFVKSFVLRAYLFFIMSMVFLLGHLFVQPYKNDNVNKLDSISLATIVLISGLSISEATYYNTAQLIPYDVKMLQILQDWFLALIPIVLLCVFFGPRAKFHFLRWRNTRENLPVSTEDDTVMFNPDIAGDRQPNEASRLNV